MKVLLLSIALLIGCSEKECVVKSPGPKIIYEFRHDALSERCGFAPANKGRSIEEYEALRLGDQECELQFRTLNNWYHRFEKDNCY